MRKAKPDAARDQYGRGNELESIRSEINHIKKATMKAIWNVAVEVLVEISRASLDIFSLGNIGGMADTNYLPRE